MIYIYMCVGPCPRESKLTERRAHDGHFDFQFHTAPELWHASCLFRPVADGIPEASLTLRAVVERASGTFLPVAQPVIYGKRAYILMQFVPDSHRQVLTHSHAPPPPPPQWPTFAMECEIFCFNTAGLGSQWSSRAEHKLKASVYETSFLQVKFSVALRPQRP